jgi:hypothetical protein
MKRIFLIVSIILLLCFHANAQSQVDLGLVQDGTYINRGFGFTFKYPKDWVVHGEATNERIKELGKEKIAESGTSKATVEVALQNTYYLLTVFRYAVGTPGITFNPAVLVMAEKVSHAPGIKNGKDYLLNTRALLIRTGYQVLLKEPVEYHFGGSQFFRDDYAVETNGVHMAHAQFSTVENGYALIFIFLGQDQTSVDEMTKSMDTFGRALPVRRGVTTVVGSAPQHKPPKRKP